MKDKNMNKIRNTLVGVIAITMASFSSAAYSFEGFSIGAAYSSLDFDTSGKEVSEGVLGSGPKTTTSKKTGSGDLGSIFAEYTFAQGSTIGVDYINGSTEIGNGTRTETGTTSGDVTVSAEIADPITFYVEPTFMMNEKFGVYVKGGATQLTVTPKEKSDTGAVVNSTYKSQDVWGIMTGVGAKYYMGNFFVKAEYTETDFGAYQHTSTAGNKNTIQADIDTEETRFALGYNF